jgi:single-strand DNA-binding protein
MNETTVTVVGNLATEPVLQYTPQGTALLRFTVASAPRIFDKSSGGFKDGDALFLLCTAWRELAENAAETLTKGMRVIVSGRLAQSTWETDAGEKRSAIAVQVDEVGPSLRFATAKVTKNPHKTTAANAA